MIKITKNKKKKGFTLIELIAVIAILAILAAIAIPNVIKYIDNAKLSALKTSASTTYTTIMAAETDNQVAAIENGTTPSAYNTTTTVQAFIGDTSNAKVFVNKPTNPIILNATISELPAIMQAKTLTAAEAAGKSSN